MQRRSTRLPNQPQKNLAEEDFEPDNDILELENDDIPLSKKTRGKKRKAKDEKADGQPQTKKVRGTRGILKQLVEMPLDVLFEIFGRLEPLDLLHLSRTTKELRALLMSRSSMSIWKQSRSNIPGLPECPLDLTEPQYANLAFGKSCHFCHRSLGTMHTAWSARVRACTKCLDDRFSARISYGSNQGYPAELTQFLPTIVVAKKTWRRTRSHHLYYLETDNTWKEEYSNVAEQDQAKWLEDKLEERRAIAAHSEACTTWFNNLQNWRDEQRATILGDRKARVVQYINQLGWEEELAKITDEFLKPQNDPLVVKLCQKDVTERSLSSLDEFFNKFMESAKSHRLVTERKTLLRERLRILNRVLETHISTLPVNALHPGVGELFRNPIVLDIIDSTPASADFTEDKFDDIFPILPAITLQWQMEIEEKLLDMIRAVVPEYSFDRQTVFQLATTTFDCSSCQHNSMRLPAVLMHPCATKYSVFAREEGDADLECLMDTLYQVYWNTGQVIAFNATSLKLMTEVVEMCGFDPKRATAAEMDAASPVLECVGCNDGHEGRATMLWWKAYSHKQTKHLHDDKMNLELLSEPEAVIVRARIAEDQERRRAGRRYRDMICVHCKQAGNTTDLRKHVKKDHGISKPTDEDVVPLLNKSSEEPTIYRLWPPREDVEESSAPMNIDAFII
ncbi:hypothetical protein GALMADRAFT_240234 [Galerina marginata CBS 339.88]|uniref:F-box domain-containing protein n=1 Tax=Galerina marginata (strain CBS 339.88) TaxID=685588 RepID=A0A067THV9_GALM3|nr:hypothetical protein GALMADRAFT_240234 [Galerina marginata CBS 339.88]